MLHPQFKIIIVIVDNTLILSRIFLQGKNLKISVITSEPWRLNKTVLIMFNKSWTLA